MNFRKYPNLGTSKNYQLQKISKKDYFSKNFFDINDFSHNFFKNFYCFQDHCIKVILLPLPGSTQCNGLMY